MDFSSKQNELKEYLKSEENLKICKPFIDESEKLAEIKNEYLTKCRGIYSDFSNHVSKKEYASDSELHRGYYCPDIISDMVIGNCHRGKLYKRLTSKTKPCFEYGFDSENRLTVVNFPGYDDHEIILYDGKSTVGILFSEDCDNGNIEIRAVCKCLYDDKMRIKEYVLANYWSDGDLDELTVEKYSYDEVGIKSVDYFRFCYVSLDKKYPCLDYRQYTFEHNQDGYLKYYIETDLTEPKLYDFENVSVHELTKKYKF